MGWLILVASLAASGMNSKHKQLGLPVKRSRSRLFDVGSSTLHVGGTFWRLSVCSPSSSLSMVLLRQSFIDVRTDFSGIPFRTDDQPCCTDPPGIQHQMEDEKAPAW